MNTRTYRAATASASLGWLLPTNIAMLIGIILICPDRKPRLTREELDGVASLVHGEDVKGFVFVSQGTEG